MIDILKEPHPILDFIQEGFIITDSHSKIIYSNHYTERLFGYTREELEGQRIRILFLEEDLTYFLPNIVYLSLYKNGFEGENREMVRKSSFPFQPPHSKKQGIPIWSSPFRRSRD